MSVEDNIIPVLPSVHVISALRTSITRLYEFFDYFTTWFQIHYFGWR